MQQLSTNVIGGVSVHDRDCSPLKCHPHSCEELKMSFSLTGALKKARRSFCYFGPSKGESADENLDASGFFLAFVVASHNALERAAVMPAL